jgi:CheY-like chemotaxis protein
LTANLLADNAVPVVVIADDEIHVVDVLGLLLEPLGVRVVKAYNGEQALAAAREHRPHLVLTNVLMPKLGGIEVCRLLKIAGGDSTVAVVLVTSLPREDLPACDADDIISKPFDTTRVEECVRRFLPLRAVDAEG